MDRFLSLGVRSLWWCVSTQGRETDFLQRPLPVSLLRLEEEKEDVVLSAGWESGATGRMDRRAGDGQFDGCCCPCTAPAQEATECPRPNGRPRQESSSPPASSISRRSAFDAQRRTGSSPLHSVSLRLRGRPGKEGCEPRTANAGDPGSRVLATDLIDRRGMGCCPVFFQYREKTERPCGLALVLCVPGAFALLCALVLVLAFALAITFGAGRSASRKTGSEQSLLARSSRAGDSGVRAITGEHVVEERGEEDSYPLAPPTIPREERSRSPIARVPLEQASIPSFFGVVGSTNSGSFVMATAGMARRVPALAVSGSLPFGAS